MERSIPKDQLKRQSIVLTETPQLSSVLIRILEWEAIGNVSDFQRQLEKDAELRQPCQNCNRYNKNQVQRDIQESAVACW